MQNVIRLSESTLYSIVEGTVKRMLSESICEEGDVDHDILRQIAEVIFDNEGASCRRGLNDCEVELDGGIIAHVEFEVESSPYIRQGMKSNDRDVPDDPDEIIDNVEVTDVSITAYDEDGNEFTINDDGTVKDAIENSVAIDYDSEDIPTENEYYDFE